MRQNADEEGVPLNENQRRSLCGYGLRYRRLRDQSDDDEAQARVGLDGSPESQRGRHSWRPTRPYARKLSSSAADTESGNAASSAAAAAKSSASAARELAAAIEEDVARLFSDDGEGAVLKDGDDAAGEGAVLEEGESTTRYKKQ